MWVDGVGKGRDVIESERIGYEFLVNMLRIFSFFFDIHFSHCRIYSDLLSTYGEEFYRLYAL